MRRRHLLTTESSGSFRDARFLDVVQLGKVLRQICIAF